MGWFRLSLLTEGGLGAKRAWWEDAMLPSPPLVLSEVMEREYCSPELGRAPDAVESTLILRGLAATYEHDSGNKRVWDAAASEKS